MLTTELLSIPQFSIVSVEKFSNVLKEQKLEFSGVTDEKTVQRVGKILGVEGIIFGSIGEYGQKIIGGPFSVGMESTFSISVKLIMVETGLTLWSGSIVASSPKSRPELQAECIKKIVLDLKQKLKLKNP